MADHDPPAMAFESLLHFHRHRLGLNQTEAATKVGRTQQMWSRWEAGLLTPTLPVLLDIADMFRIDPREVLYAAAYDAQARGEQ